MVLARSGGRTLTRPGPGCVACYMNRNFVVSARHARPARTAEPTEPAAVEAHVRAARIALADRACCCSARPVAAAIMPPWPGRSHPVDLLFCGHHLRAAKAGLEAAGAVIHYARLDSGVLGS